MQAQPLFKLTMLVLLVVSLLVAACGGRPDRDPEVAVNSSQANSSASAGVANQGGLTIDVTLKEMTVALDKAQASAGPITFVVQNNGHIPHDFGIKVNGVEQKTPLLEPGRSASLTVTLAPGTYEYRCAVPGHDMAGMRGAFIVR